MNQSLSKIETPKHFYWFGLCVTQNHWASCNKGGFGHGTVEKPGHLGQSLCKTGTNPYFWWNPNVQWTDGPKQGLCWLNWDMWWLCMCVQYPMPAPLWTYQRSLSAHVMFVPTGFDPGMRTIKNLCQVGKILVFFNIYTLVLSPICTKLELSIDCG